MLGYSVDVENAQYTVSTKSKEAVTKLHPPRNLSQLRSLIGLIEWAGNKGVPHLSEEMAPITDLMTGHKEAFSWTPEADQALKALKIKVSNQQTLALPSAHSQWRVSTDASEVGEGGVLELMEGREGKPVEFWSRKFTSTERSWSINEKEAHAVVRALSRWRPYLEGVKFELVTDHLNLVFLRTSANQKSSAGIIRSQIWISM